MPPNFGRDVIVRKSLVGGVLIVAVALAGCSSGSDAQQKTTRTTRPVKPAPTTSAPPSTKPGDNTTPAVLNAWESAEQTLYKYMQQPWQQDRAGLVAGETSSDLWPQLSNYFANPALQSEFEFLTGIKMSQLNGPTTYDLGHPTVTSLAGGIATVAGCVYDTGTTTTAGQPGPATLDGGAGGGTGTWTVQFLGGSWKVTTFKTTSVPKC